MNEKFRDWRPRRSKPKPAAASGHQSFMSSLQRDMHRGPPTYRKKPADSTPSAFQSFHGQCSSKYGSFIFSKEPFDSERA